MLQDRWVVAVALLMRCLPWIHRIRFRGPWSQESGRNALLDHPASSNIGVIYLDMDAQPNRGGRRRRRRNKHPKKEATPIEPVFIAARRPDSPRLEKPTRRMKAASAKPKTREESVRPEPVEAAIAEPKRRREARIVQRRPDEIDETEKTRRRLLSRFMASEGRAQVTRAADEYLHAGFVLPREQEAHLKLLEHFDEARARQAIEVLSELVGEQDPRQLPVFRQRLRRLEDYADEPTTREAAASLRRSLPA